MTITTGIRYTLPGDDTRVETVDNAVVRMNRIIELIRSGASAEPVTIEVNVQPTLATTYRRMANREAALHIAQLVFEGEVTAEAAVLDLKQFSGLDEQQRAEKLADLVHELEHQATVEARDYDTGLCGPGEDHQRLCEDADERVTSAADALIGGIR